MFGIIWAFIVQPFRSEYIQATLKILVFSGPKNASIPGFYTTNKKFSWQPSDAHKANMRNSSPLGFYENFVLFELILKGSQIPKNPETPD